MRIVEVPKVLWVRDCPAPPGLYPSVAFVDGLLEIVLDTGENRLSVIGKKLFYVLVELRLVLFEGQHIVGLSVDYVLGDILLAPDRVDGHDTPRYFQHL